jgi:hypothetical protein
MASIYGNSGIGRYKLIYSTNDTFYKSELEKTVQLQIEEISLLQYYFNDMYFDNLYYKSIFEKEIKKKLIEFYAEAIKKLEDLIYKNNLGLIKIEQLAETSKTTPYTKRSFKKFMKKLNSILKEYNIPTHNSDDADKYIVGSFFFDMIKLLPIDTRTVIFKNIAPKFTEKIKCELNIIDIDRKKIIWPILYNLFSKYHYILELFYDRTFHNILNFILHFTYIINCKFMSNLWLKESYLEIDYDNFDINNINDNIKYYCDSFCNIIGNEFYEYNIKNIRFLRNYKNIFGDLLCQIQIDIIKYYCDLYTIIESLKDIDDLKIFVNNHLKTIYGINDNDASKMFLKVFVNNIEVPKTASNAIYIISDKKTKELVSYTGNLFDDDDIVITEFPVYIYYFENCSGGFMRFRFDNKQNSIIASIGIAKGIDKISIQDVLSSKDFDIEIRSHVTYCELLHVLDTFISIIRTNLKKNNDKSSPYYYKISNVFDIMIKLFGNVKNLGKHYYVTTNNPDIGISGYDEKFCMIYDFNKSDSIVKFNYSF